MRGIEQRYSRRRRQRPGWEIMHIFLLIPLIPQIWGKLCHLTFPRIFPQASRVIVVPQFITSTKILEGNDFIFFLDSLSPSDWEITVTKGGPRHVTWGDSEDGEHQEGLHLCWSQWTDLQDNRKTHYTQSNFLPSLLPRRDDGTLWWE